MKKDFKLFAVTLSVLAIVLSCGSALADTVMGKVAVVDVPKVVSSSTQVKKLKDERAKKMEELSKWISNAQKDIEKQKVDSEKQKLIKKYDAELTKKRAANDKDYSQKLVNIDNSISQTISNYAKTKGYDVVLAKTVVLYGGTDVTDEIIKIVK